MSKYFTKYSHKAVSFCSSRPSLVRSEFRDDCDIRRIIERHSIVPPVRYEYVDTTLLDGGMQGLLEFARQVAADFDALPAKARERFNYDSEAFVSFLANPSNRQEAISLGLIAPDTVSAPAPVNKE